jgi:cytidyltransferase-like protein
MKTAATGGVFDILRYGHVRFLKECSKYGELHVILAPDRFVREYKFREPIFNQSERKVYLERLNFVKKVWIDHLDISDEGSNSSLASLLEIRPDVFLIGTKQEQWLKDVLRRRIKSMGLHTELVQILEEYDCFRSSDFITHGIVNKDFLEKMIEWVISYSE